MKKGWINFRYLHTSISDYKGTRQKDDTEVILGDLLDFFFWETVSDRVPTSDGLGVL